MIKEIKELSDSELREAIKSLGNTTWDETNPLYELAERVYGEGALVSNILMLATPLALELEARTAPKSEPTALELIK